MKVLEENIDKNTINMILEFVLPRQREIIILRHGLNDTARYTFNQIAEMRGLTRQTVGQMYWRGIERIRRALRIEA